MKDFIRNPLTIWLIWYSESRRLLFKNRKKKLKIGYLTRINNTSFGIYNTFYSNITIGNSKFGSYVYVSNNSRIINSNIGNFCSIGSNVKIGLSKHPTEFFTTFPAFYSTNKQCQITFVDQDYYDENGSNIIGNDVWIGDNALILSNVKIGDGAIIGAGAVVTKDVKPYSIVGGVPANHIKFRFDENTVNEYLNLRWWDKDIDWIKKKFLKTF